MVVRKNVRRKRMTLQSYFKNDNDNLSIKSNDGIKNMMFQRKTMMKALILPALLLVWVIVCDMERSHYTLGSIYYGYKLRRLSKTVDQSKIVKGNAAKNIWDDVNYNYASGSIRCGSKKCFFPSLSDSTVGYMIGPTASYLKEKSSNRYPYYNAYPEEQRSHMHTAIINNNLFDVAQNAYEFEQCMKEDVTLKGDYLNIAPPQLLSLTEEMNSNIQIPSSNNNNNNNAGKEETSESIFHAPGNVIIQKVRRIPSPHILLGCDSLPNNNKNHDDDDHYWDELHGLFLHSNTTMKNNDDSSMMTFYENFKRGIAMTQKIYIKNPCLYRNMEFIVDYMGNVHHHDLDRCPSHGFKKCTKSYPEQARMLNTIVVQSSNIDNNDEENKNKRINTDRINTCLSSLDTFVTKLKNEMK